MICSCLYTLNCRVHAVRVVSALLFHAVPLKPSTTTGNHAKKQPMFLYKTVYKMGSQNRGHKIEGLLKGWINPSDIPFYKMGPDVSVPKKRLCKMSPVSKTHSLQNDS